MFEEVKKNLGRENFLAELESIPEEIRDLEEPMKSILEKMRNAIEAGEYQLIIGDDASGRIPTRLFGNIITARYREIGYSSPKIRFFAGSTFPGSPHIQAERVEKCKKLKAGGGVTKALLVTDTVSSGTALSGIIVALKEADISYDVATIAVESSRSIIKLETKLGCRIFYGPAGVTPLIYLKPHLSGVFKKGDGVYAKRRMFKEEGDSELLKEARNGVDILSRVLLAWYRQ